MECPECLCTAVVEDSSSGDTICTGCGLVLEAHAYQNPAVHEGAIMVPVLGSQTISRCPRSLLHATGDASRLRSLITSTADLRAACSRLELPDVIVEHAAILWAEVLEHRTCKGNCRKGLMAACIYFACKFAQVGRPRDVVAASCFLPPYELAKAIRMYATVHSSKDVTQCAPTDSSDVLAMCVNRAIDIIPDNLQRKVTAKARVEDVAICRLGVLEGRTPVLRAAVAIHFTMARYSLPTGKLAKSLGMSPPTLSRAVSLVTSALQQQDGSKSGKCEQHQSHKSQPVQPRPTGRRTTLD